MNSDDKAIATSATQGLHQQNHELIPTLVIEKFSEYLFT